MTRHRTGPVEHAVSCPRRAGVNYCWCDPATPGSTPALELAAAADAAGIPPGLPDEHDPDAPHPDEPESAEADRTRNAERCHECGDFYWLCRDSDCPGDFVDEDD